MPDRKWVFDTVSLGNFLLADAIPILETRYGKRCFVTFEVYGEISAGTMKYPNLREIDRFIDAGLFSLISLSDKARKRFATLLADLGKGEASCIAFARDEKAIVITDDRAARKRCALMNIPFTGTLGILKASVLDGQISLSYADNILEKMIQAGFYAPVRHISDIV